MSRFGVIGVAGKARSGKDTVTEFILAAIGGYQYSFVEPIRRMLNAGFGIDMHDPYWQKHKEDPIPILGKSPRQLMQTLGTEWGRELVHENVWLILAMQTLQKRGPGMVISDIRFENEAAWVRSVGGSVLHLERPNAQQVNPHASEAGIIRHHDDLVIVNNGTLEELQAKVMALYETQ